MRHAAVHVYIHVFYMYTYACNSIHTSCCCHVRSRSWCSHVCKYDQAMCIPLDQPNRCIHVSCMSHFTEAREASVGPAALTLGDQGPVTRMEMHHVREATSGARHVAQGPVDASTTRPKVTRGCRNSTEHKAAPLLSLHNK